LERESIRRKVVLTVLVVILFMLFGGQVIPRVLLTVSPAPTGLITSDSREFAQAALVTAHDLTDNSLEVAMQTGYRLQTLQKTSNATGCGMVRVTNYAGHYTAVIRAYTWFGIPYADITINCDGAAVQRLPWLFFIGK
jgi:hypothetical protein